MKDDTVMVVWRVETNGHEGPFQGHKDFVPLGRAIVGTENVWIGGHDHPAAYEDFHMIGPCHFFGCKNFKDLRHWFGTKRVVEYLNSHAFKIVQYEVHQNDVLRSKSDVQVAFDMVFASKKKVFSMIALLNSEEPT